VASITSGDRWCHTKVRPTHPTGFGRRPPPDGRAAEAVAAAGEGHSGAVNESTSTPPRAQQDAPDYGPRGYLPERAARRARKIILREQMGLHWPLAAVGAAIALALVAVAFLLRSGAPDAPFAPAGDIEQVGRHNAAIVKVEATGEDVLAVRGGGRVRAFAPPEGEVRFCQESRRLESPSGSVWTLEGVLVGGEGSGLRPAESVVYEGVLYVDTRALETAAPMPANPRGETPTCGG
jgi:hypothetical protein